MEALAQPIPFPNVRRRPQVIAVPKAEIVGDLMDWQALVAEAEKALDANAYGLQTVLDALSVGPIRHELQRSHIDALTSLKTLLIALRGASARYESTQPITD